MKMQGIVALVTGGGSGLGAASVRYLAKKGAKVVILDKAQQTGEKLAGEINGLFVPGDVSKPADVKNMFDTVLDNFSAPRIIVNCAGIAAAGKMVDKTGQPLPLADFENVIHVNLLGTFNVMSQGAAHMMQLSGLEGNETRGVIINTASIAAFEGQIGQTAYSASKGGIVGMTLPAARELAPFAIRVNTIAPGLMNTPLIEKMPEKVQISLLNQCLYPNRLGHADEFAAMVAHVIENDYLNGSVIRLDGGVRLGAR